MSDQEQKPDPKRYTEISSVMEFIRTLPVPIFKLVACYMMILSGEHTPPDGEIADAESQARDLDRFAWAALAWFDEQYTEAQCLNNNLSREQFASMVLDRLKKRPFWSHILQPTVQ